MGKHSAFLKQRRELWLHYMNSWKRSGLLQSELSPQFADRYVHLLAVSQKMPYFRFIYDSCFGSTEVRQG